MMTRKLFNLILLALVAGAAVACHEKTEPEMPENPEPEILPAKPFTFTLTEVRQTKTFAWEVDETGKTNNHEESIKELYVTKYNTVTLEATEEVNVTTDKPEMVSVTRVSNKVYSFLYQGDGTVRVTVWNGEGASRIEQAFQVKGQECVDITGVKFLWYKYDRETRTCSDDVISINHYKDKHIAMGSSYYIGPRGSIGDKEEVSDFYFDSDYNDWDNIFIWGPNEDGIIDRLGTKPYGHEMVFLGFEPENTSFRHILGFESEYIRGIEEFYQYMIRSGEVEIGTYLWLNKMNLDCDVTDIFGTSAYLGLDGRYPFNPFYMALIAVQADITRYYYLYHSKDAHAKATDEDRHGHG